MVRAKHFLLFVAACFFAAFSLHAKEIHNYRWRYSANIPANWLPELGDDSSQRQVFRSPDKRLLLEVYVWERREIQGLRAMYLSHLRDLEGSGVVSQYRHIGYDVLLARIDYHAQRVSQQAPIQETDKLATTEPLELEGRLEAAPAANTEQEEKGSENNTVAYVFYFYGAQYAYRVASIGPANVTSLERDVQYSVLDSFGFEGHNYWNWGPISSFFVEQKTKKLLADREAATAGNSLIQSQNLKQNLVFNQAGLGKTQQITEFVNWRLGNLSYRGLQNPVTIQVAQDVLEREKRILMATPEQLYPYALVRFYRMNFRQNYQSLKDLAVFLEKSYTAPDREVLPLYEHLLYDLQTMLLSSDRSIKASVRVPLELPVAALQQGAGNIETLALIHAILVSQFQHNALILYAPKYSQLLVGTEELGVKEEALAQKYSPQGNVKNFEKYNGISISWYKNRFLIGELTAPIYIGWARTPLRDLRNWIPMTFPRYIPPSFFP